MDLFLNLLLIVTAYLVGSIPFGLVLTKYAGLGDIRTIGSGNIGATNVMRTGNKKLAIATLLLDAFKGVVIVLIAKELAPKYVSLLCGMAAIIGHVFPVWLNFKGGKGVATTIAVYYAIYPPLGIFASVTWIAVFLFSRISSLSSILAIALSNTISIVLGGDGLFFATFLITVIVVYKHKENINRLLSGEEKPFVKKAKEVN